MTRFVILEHDHPHLHWDLMLQAGDRLRTWRLPAPPQAGRTLVVEPIADHRLAYLDYEGPIAGGRGSVRRWDAGHCTWNEDGPDRVVVDLFGGRVDGRMEIVREGSGWELGLAPSEGRGLEGGAG